MVNPLRLGSFNLLSGRSLTDGTVDVRRLVAAIGELDVDLLAVQEVDRGQPRSGLVDQAGVIADTLGATDSRFVATVHGARRSPDGTSSSIVSAGSAGSAGSAPDQAEFGVALLSRMPVAEWHVLRLPPAPGRYPLVIPNRPPQVWWVKDEPRVVVAAVLERPRITVAGTHLSFVPLSNVRQLRAVRRWLDRLPAPQVLLGDLNLPVWLARRISGSTPLVSSPTYPSPAPVLQLDHVLASRLPAGARAEGRVLKMPISDHRAVRADLYLPRSSWDGEDHSPAR
jgi:endonuclease/exonuclease/phosphatase family metal-dependent hydrolase